MIDYNKILAAHYRTRLPMIVWGSSGYGKSSIVQEFAKKHSFRLKTLHAQYLDPLSLFIPSTTDMAEKGFAKFYPSDLIYEIINTKERTVLFLDEITRAREDTLNILTELFLERRVFGYAIPSKVLIVAASNFSEEDIGVKELPDAVVQRLTHLIHAPTTEEAAQNLQHPLAKKALELGRNCIAKPAHYPILDRLRACPRQIDACASLAEGGLKDSELLAVCQGRVGIEAGAELSFALNRATNEGLVNFPKLLNPASLLPLSLFEEKGAVIEVIEFLRNQMQSPDRSESIANYLLFHARPETCRALQTFQFRHEFVAAPKAVDGKVLLLPCKDQLPIEANGGKPWQWYATRIGKLKSR